MISYAFVYSIIGMDALTGLLDGPRAVDAFVLRALLDPPWSLHIRDEAPLALIAVTDGWAWLVPDDGEPVLVSAGDIAVVSGTDPYIMADSPDTPPQVIVHPGQRCTTIDGADLSEVMGLGVRTWGNAADPTGGTCRMLIGIYESASEVGQRFIAALPPLAVLPADEHQSPLLAVLSAELGHDRPGQSLILSRLLDLLVIASARALFERPGGHAPDWYTADADPIVGPALRLLHEAPAQRWTVASLASEVGVSRALFARRFSECMNVPPMTYLTELRISLAADLLRSGQDSVTAVASQVGYSTPYSFSSAFKRLRGTSPTGYRSTTLVTRGLS